MSQQSLVQAKTKPGPTYTNNQHGHVTKSKLLWKVIFSFKVILFSVAKRFTLSDYKTRAVASLTQPERGEFQVGHLFPILMIIS